MIVRIEDQVFRGGRLIGVLVPGKGWHRYSNGAPGKRTLTPIEPQLSAGEARDLKDCQRAVTPAPPTDPIADKLAWIDRNFPRKRRRG